MRHLPTKPLLIRASYFAWVIAPVCLVLGYLILGLPHVIWSYAWRDQGQGYDPHAFRYYTRCTFIGPYGAFTTYPTNGKCGWVRFFKESDGGNG